MHRYFYFNRQKKNGWQRRRTPFTAFNSAQTVYTVASTVCAELSARVCVCVRAVFCLKCQNRMEKNVSGFRHSHFVSTIFLLTIKIKISMHSSKERAWILKMKKKLIKTDLKFFNDLFLFLISEKISIYYLII